MSLSKNDSDHYRLVDLACRHLALAAAINVFQPKQQSTNTDEPSSPTTNGNGKEEEEEEVVYLDLKSWLLNRS